MTGKFKLSFRVMVMVEVVVPSAVTGPVPVMVEFAATAEPVAKTTVPPVTATGVKRLRVFVWAVVEAREQIEIPLISVVLHVP